MTSFYVTFIVILLLIPALLWILARRTNHHKHLAIKHITTALKEENLQDDQKSRLQQQLAAILLQDNSKKTPVWIVSAVIIILGSLLYQRIGLPEAAAFFTYSANTKSPASQQASGTVPDMQTALAILKNRLSSDPDNVDNWLLYGRSMMAMKDYAEAARAYEKARQLQPKNAWILASLAEAKAFAAGTGTFRGEPEQLLQQALNLDPNSQKALWLLGMNAYEKGETKKAEELWSRLLVLIEDPRVAEQLRTQLNMIRHQQSGSTANENTNDGDTVAISLRVTITPEMKTHLSNKPAVLYVYAKPTTGMPMPIAVVRGNASDLPLTLVLSDANNLQPERKLSQFEQVKLGARISFSGTATPQTGDIESEEILITPDNHEKTVTLTLNKIR